MAINQTVGAMGSPRRPLGFSRLPDKPHFYLQDKAFPGCKANISQWKKMVKIHFLRSPVIGTPICQTSRTDIDKNLHRLRKTIVFINVLGHQARTEKQRDWLHETEQTAKYDYNFHDFFSDILLASLFSYIKKLFSSSH